MHAGGLLGCNPKSWRPGCHPCGTAGPGCSKESAARPWPHLLGQHPLAVIVLHGCLQRQRKDGVCQLLRRDGHLDELRDGGGPSHRRAAASR